MTSTDQGPLEARYHATLATIRSAEQRFGRPEGSVALLAVGKRHSAGQLARLAHLGQQRFAESYIQEAMAKIEQLASLGLEWHFIGPLQSNKTRLIAENFAWAHSVDRLKIAQRLSQQRPDHLPPLNVCIQANISNESAKSGCPTAELAELAAAVDALPRLSLRGLMAIPARANDLQQQRIPFRQLATLKQAIDSGSSEFDTLSMGMSEDMDAAIAEGATVVRIGTALFGPRGALPQENRGDS